MLNDNTLKDKITSSLWENVMTEWDGNDYLAHKVVEVEDNGYLYEITYSAHIYTEYVERWDGDYRYEVTSFDLADVKVEVTQDGEDCHDAELINHVYTLIDKEYYE